MPVSLGAAREKVPVPLSCVWIRWMTPGEWRPRGPDRLKASTQSVGVTPALGQGRLGEGRHLGLHCITPRAKNYPAFGRNWISWWVRIVAPIPKYHQQQTHVSHVTCHVSHLRCHVSAVSCQVSHVTCLQHQWPQPQTLPLLTVPLCSGSPRKDPKT